MFGGGMAKNCFFMGVHEITQSFAFEGAISNDAKVVWVVTKFPRFTMWAIVGKVFIKVGG